MALQAEPSLGVTEDIASALQRGVDDSTAEQITESRAVDVLVVSRGCEKPSDEEDDELLFQPPVHGHNASITPIELTIDTRVMDFDSFVLGQEELRTPSSDEDESSFPMEEEPAIQEDYRSSRSVSASDGSDGDRESTASSTPSSVDRGSLTSALHLRGTFKRPSLKLGTGAVAKLQNMKQKTKEVASQQRSAMRRFQDQGGLVGWLHGEASGLTDAESTDAESTRVRELIPVDFAPTTQTEHVDTVPPKASTPPRPLTGTPTSRVTVQPSPRKKQADSTIGFDDFVVEDPPKSTFRRDSRLRSASSGNPSQGQIGDASSGPRVRSLSLAARSSSKLWALASGGGNKTTISQRPPQPSALNIDLLPMEDCLADPKLAAEFISTVLPGNEWLLALLYSINEFEALLTADPLPTLDTQVAAATAIIDRFLLRSAASSSEFESLVQLGMQARDAVAPFETSVPTMASPVLMLPKSFFNDVYALVHDRLREAYDVSFRRTKEYTQLLAERQQRQQQLLAQDDHATRLFVLSFDQVLESEWCCTVFWAFLFRTSHHHRLSFIMDVKFKLRRLHLAAQELVKKDGAASPSAAQALRRLQREIEVVNRRFLSGKLTASVALPLTSAMLVRLRDEICKDVEQLTSDYPDAARLWSIMEKLDSMRTQIRTEFKRISLERFSSFVSSTLYRDFIVHPDSATSTNCSRSDDLVQLFRVTRIPFHQTPAAIREIYDLQTVVLETDENASFERTIELVVAFREQKDAQETRSPSRRQFTYRALFSADTWSYSHAITQLDKVVQPFLTPESSSSLRSDGSDSSAVCFNFKVGGTSAPLYGAVWRFPIHESESCGGTDTAKDHVPASPTVQGVCVLSRYPLVDGLREFLRAFANDLGSTVIDVSSDDVSAAVRASQTCFNGHITWMRQQAVQPAIRRGLPVIDTTLEDLFECLSITHAMRLFSLALQEKKIILVSSSYSVLLSVGEALCALLFPLEWSHVYVPILPIAMKGYLHCPTPCIFGLHTSYAGHCELPKTSDDLAIVNLDRNSITGGGDVVMPPARSCSLRSKLVKLCQPRLQLRDQVTFSSHQSTSGESSSTSRLPSDAIRAVFHEELQSMLDYLETFTFRFECTDRTVSVVDASNKARHWPADAARFYSTVLQSQAFSSYLGRQQRRPEEPKT
ncbi:hypothetical protein PINS_up000707 [Pythium insidiosum]|nr:hypothetical protein PINS_up000707 [Pythium insidiosum]